LIAEALDLLLAKGLKYTQITESNIVTINWNMKEYHDSFIFQFHIKMCKAMNVYRDIRLLILFYRGRDAGNELKYLNIGYTKKFRKESHL